MKHAPTHFGLLGYEIVSDVDHGKITATLELPSRTPPRAVLLRVRHPTAKPIQNVTVNGKDWRGFDPARELIRLEGLQGTVAITAAY